jgi:rhamnosyltransferase
MTSPEAGRTFALGVVTYSPPDSLWARLAMSERKGHRIYVYDNSPDDCSTRRNLTSLSEARYFTAGKNLGLGVALSTICAAAYYDSCGTLLFFDQDTVFDERTIDYVEQFCRTALRDYERSHTAIVFSSAATGSGSNSRFAISDVPLAISSGSLFVLENLKMLGWHNEHYFVDGVDYELCLRSLIKNLKIARCGNTPGFDHVSGQPDRTVELWGKSIALRHYAPARILDAFRSYTQLFFSSLSAGQFKFAARMVRAGAIYAFGQTMARTMRR